MAVVDGALAHDLGDPNAGVNPNIVGSAYTNSVFGAMTTTLFGIDSVLDILVIQGPPNVGGLNTVGPLGVDTSDQVGFDISGASGVAFASLTSGGVPQLFTIKQATGAAGETPATARPDWGGEAQFNGGIGLGTRPKRCAPSSGRSTPTAGRGRRRNRCLARAATV